MGVFMMNQGLPKGDSLTIGVMCGASPKCSPEFAQASADIAKHLALAGYRFVYGGGSFGLMGAFASTALQHGAELIGVMPEFMKQVEWDHDGLSDLIVTEDLSQRKAKMYQLSDHILILPGGLGTLDELFDVLMNKRFGLFDGNIILYNQDGFFDDLLAFMKSLVQKKFAESTDRDLWTVVSHREGIVEAINARAKDHKNLLDRCAEVSCGDLSKSVIADIWTTS